MIKVKGQEVQKIMTRTRNLFVPNFDYNRAYVVKDGDSTLITMHGDVCMSSIDALKIFKSSKTYTLSFDLEFMEVPPYTYAVEALGFNLYDVASKTVLSKFTSYVQPSQIVVGNKIHMSITRTMPADLMNAVLIAYSGYCRNADENNKWYYVTARFSDIMLTEGTEEVDYVPYMSEVKTLAWGVKEECKIVLDGSEPWVRYSGGTVWIGTSCGVTINVHELRDAQYNNYWGFQDYGKANKFLWLQKTASFIAWQPGSPPFASWETTNADGKAIANIPQIKADLAKRNLVVYYDNTNSRPKTLAELLKIVRREVYNNNTEEVVS